MPMNTKQKSLLGLGIVAVALLFVLAYFYVPQTSGTAVAKVNNEIITNSELKDRVDQTIENFSAQGLEANQEQIEQIRNQAIESLINEKLIFDYAEENNIEASEEEVEKEYSSMVFFYSGEENLEIQLESFGVSKEVFRENLRKNIIFKNSIENFSSLELTVTEEEIRNVYSVLEEEAQKSELESELPSFEESRPWLEHQLKEQKILNESENFLTHLRSEAEVEIF